MGGGESRLEPQGKRPGTARDIQNSRLTELGHGRFDLVDHLAFEDSFTSRQRNSEVVERGEPGMGESGNEPFPFDSRMQHEANQSSAGQPS